MSELGSWKRRTIACALLLFLATMWAARQSAPPLALYLVQSQDVPVLVIASLGMLLIALWRPHWALPAHLRGLPLLVGALVLAAFLGWGAYALLGNFPLSRDEHMVVFDMAVFAKGHLAEPVAPQWRDYVPTLAPEFLLNLNHPTGLVSSYLPMNALLRLGFSKVADPVLYNPLLVVLGGAALLDIARRVFGPQDSACIVVLLLYVLSAQVLANAMTNYAMTGHLALNLVWLAAFLRGGKLWNAIAILVGFVAVGLHQIAFHPVFVAPFLLWRLRDGQWKLVLLYAAAYAAILAWWITYPILVSPLVTAAGAPASDDNLLSDRVIPLLLNRDPRTIPLMALNMLRFFAWQNFALLPLLIAGLPIALRERGFPRALLLGIAIWILFLALVLPEQGRAYGYRYLNGYVGSFALLGGYGYRELEQRMARGADGLVILLSGLTAVLAIPALFLASYRFMQPHLAMQRLIEAQPTPFVIIDDNPSPSLDGRWRDTGRDHVRNLPDFSNRPLRFSAERLTPQLLAGLCRAGPVTLVTRADMHRLDYLLNVPERSPKLEALVAATGSPGCLRSAVRR